MPLAAVHLYERPSDDFAATAARPGPVPDVGARFVNHSALDDTARRAQARRGDARIHNHREHATQSKPPLCAGPCEQAANRLRRERRVEIIALAVFASQRQQASGLFVGLHAFSRHAQVA